MKREDDVVFPFFFSTCICYTLSLFLLMKSPRMLSRINVINMPMRINGSYFLLRS